MSDFNNNDDEIHVSKNNKQTYEVEVMLSVKHQLEAMPDIKQNQEYLDILKRVKKYLHKYCNHYIVHDSIDIDPDRSQDIVYCTICESTL